MAKDLKEKAIDIKGKKYVLVSDRVKYFNDAYKNGSIRTELISDWSSPYIVVKAVIVPDVANIEQCFTGFSQANVGEGMVNKTAALENAETSAVGRALGMMGIGVLESIASADEMAKTTHGETKVGRFATDKQIKWLRDTMYEANDQLTGMGDEAIDKAIAEILTIPPQQVPIWKVKDAVEKIKSVTGNPTITDEDIDKQLAMVDTSKEINLDDIPY